MNRESDYDIDVAADLRSVRGTTQHVEPFDWFARLWGIAVIAHIVGNPRVGQAVGDPSILGWVTLATGLTAVALVVRSANRRLLRAVCVGVLAMVWFEAPFLGNHWLLAGFVSTAILLALGRSGPWSWFSTTGRGIHLAFYAFAAFAKLNASFFDTSVSCAVLYTNESLSAVGLPQVSADTALAGAVVLGTVLIEVSVPVLLIVRRTRRAGMLLGLVFHTVISFDLGQHFFDFTALLIPLFLLWADPAVPRQLGKPMTRNLESMVAATLTVFVVVSVLPLTAVTLTLLTQAVFVLWIPAALALVGYVVSRRGDPPDLAIRPPGAVAWLLVALVIFNGLTPYLEVKTGTSWNMYSNLVTAEGESNHFLIRSTFPLTKAQEDPVTILDSDDPGLREYVDSGYVLPERTFLDYLDEHPGISARISQDGEMSTVTAAEGLSLNPIVAKFALLRAIDTERPVRCQNVWLPAR